MGWTARQWTAIVPMKQGQARKSRLAPHLSPAQRIRLNEQMTAHVLDQLARVSAISRIVALSPAPPAQAGIGWARDQGRGINVELAALRQGVSPLLVIHGDLPLLQAADVEALLAAAETHDLAIAPDRHGLGTNALALGDDRAFRFAFGEGSARAHQADAGRAAVSVTRLGLSHDVDTVEDLQIAMTHGFDPGVAGLDGDTVRLGRSSEVGQPPRETQVLKDFVIDLILENCLLK